MIARGTCFAMETSYGDARPSWFIYWRVKDSIAGFTECYRFETRSDGLLVMNPAEPVLTALLESLTPMSAEDWHVAYVKWGIAVSEPWHVE